VGTSGPHSSKPKGPDAIHCHLGQSSFLSFCSGPKLVSSTPTITVQYLPPYTPFLNPIKAFFSAWRWKVYDLRPYVQMALIQAMEEACDQIEAASIQEWICHSKIFFSRCLANGNIACDVDKALWLNPARRRDVFFFLFGTELDMYFVTVLL